MTYPIHVWRLNELQGKRTLRVGDDGAYLKIVGESWQLWLEPIGVVRIEEKQDDGSWKVVERYPAKTT